MSMPPSLRKSAAETNTLLQILRTNVHPPRGTVYERQPRAANVSYTFRRQVLATGCSSTVVGATENILYSILLKSTVCDDTQGPASSAVAEENGVNPVNGQQVPAKAEASPWSTVASSEEEMGSGTFVPVECTE